MTFNGHRNRLGLERSPYLLQHADNPVDWYPWGNEAFAKAARENRPVFLSIGYSTCHWCHVMAHESFENPAVADLMNAAFVCVKVDREERPDIDLTYMTAARMMTGSGGWPLTLILTPDKQPFFAGAYFPREPRFGQIGLIQLIRSIQAAWSKQQTDVIKTAAQITSTIKEGMSVSPGKDLDESVIDTAFRALADTFDSREGGFGAAPKFPTPHNLSFLLRYWKRTGDLKALAMVEMTLQKMHDGGIYDHIGFGFHRYSTDAQWRVPHFEKMLYDQALLAMAYLEAFQSTQKEEYSRMAREIFEYVFRKLTAPAGGFYSAEDADSEGEEGKFYLWTVDQLTAALSAEEFDLAVKVFNIRPDVNFEDTVSGQRNGLNIIFQIGSENALAAEFGLPVAELTQNIETIRLKLFATREKRVPPFRDDKILTDWNGLMIAVLAMGARVLNDSRYAEAAKRAADFILTSARPPDRRLLHRLGCGQTAPAANLDDYAFLIYGLTELYTATFDEIYLSAALELNQDMIKHFWDGSEEGFFYTADYSENPLFRPKEIYDGATPSGNSIAMLNLLRLGRITANSELAEKAAGIGRAFYTAIQEIPSAHTQLLIALDFALGPSYEIVIVGDRQSDAVRQMLDILSRDFLPGKVVILRDTGRLSSPITDIAPWTKALRPLNNTATAYVCRQYHCELPVRDVESFKNLLGGL
jgi:uncharacterized protein